MKEVNNFFRAGLIGVSFLALFPVLLTAGENSISSTIGSLGSALGKKIGLVPASKTFLKPDNAFIFSATIADGGKILAYWQIAEGYYLYKDKFVFSTINDKGNILGQPQFPPGKMKEDETFGLMEVFYNEVEISIPVQVSAPKKSSLGESSLVFETHYQGCAEGGLCYPLIKKQLTLILPD